MTDLEEALQSERREEFARGYVVLGMLSVHDCGAPYFTGQAHICDDVRLAHEGCDEES